MPLLHVLLLLPFLLAAALPWLSRLAPRLHAGWIALAGPLLLLAGFLRLRTAGDGAPLSASMPWMPSLGVNLELRLDGLAMLFALLISGIGALVVLYSIFYLDRRREAVGRFYACLLLFMGAMLGVVLSDHLIVLYGFWELTSVSSFLLIAFWHRRQASLDGALKSLLVTGMGGLAMLAGFLLLGIAGDSLRVSELIGSAEALAASPLLLPAMGLILLGVFTKSAQFPFHIWLPDAMEAPTPVSAYLHSATMVKAGLYLAARLTPLFAGQQLWYGSLTAVGLATLVYGSFRAIKQTDLKALLAYSTISQLGLVTALIGLGSVYPAGSASPYAAYGAAAAAAGLLHLLNHAAFKGALFMTAGIVDHETGTRDLRRLGGLIRFMPVTFAVSLAASLSMAGVPPLGGFLSKELFFGSALNAYRAGEGSLAALLVPAVAWTASAFTFVYSGIFAWRTFGGPARETREAAVHEPSWGLLAPPLVLAAAALLLGLAPALVAPGLLQPALLSMHPAAPDAYGELALWHGVTPELLLTAAVFAVGGLLLYAAPRWAPLHRTIRLPLSWNGMYERLLRGLDAGSEKLTAAYMDGGMRRSAGYIFLALAAFLIVAAAMAGDISVVLSGMAPVTLFEGIAVLALIAATLAVPFAQSRMMAIILTGTVGYMVVLFFVLFRAPDLALTQMIVETVSVTLFLLCFYHLPALKRERVARRTKLASGLIAGAAGLAMTLVALGALSDRKFGSISDFYLRNSYELAGGKNVVNVILVDFRGFDTMLEIVVLGIASYAIYAIIRLKWPGEAEEEGSGLRESEFRLVYEDARSNDVILQTLAKVILFLILTFSLYLLFAGHHQPGGGFIGALMTASALVLMSIAFGVRTIRKALPVDFRIVSACGISLALLTGIGSFAFGKPFLSHAFGYAQLPFFGQNELATAVLFDLGVYFTVVGITMTIILAIGRDK
ncbi:Na(+) H(+) antiporter subunit A [Paenibacillus pasadenensis]|uniref:Na(+) H(+) antiporter subunit A n=1 Tax=Paenibacillus pasadenensis TaxID=217090 RepID=A0A2N5N6W1_9BACL|nr:hydrogen gas-evolving membrane-bound hydrogenase subunit E [Paenibacillus pasadenensis]PLT46087.1 Na(+) H(+) antiporter subunit A [Paenibacillus pasadenensis]